MSEPEQEDFEAEGTCVKNEPDGAKYYELKLDRLKQCLLQLEQHKGWMTESRWDETFDVKFEAFFKKMADPGLKLFMGFESLKGDIDDGHNQTSSPF